MSLIAGRGYRWPPRRDSVSPCAPLSGGGGGGRDTHDGHENSPILVFFSNLLKPEHWRNAAPIRAIFRQAFTTAGLPYFNPHSLRNALIQFGQELCRTPEDFKAWSQNPGHEGVLTTFRSYGAVGNQAPGGDHP